MGVCWHLQVYKRTQSELKPVNDLEYCAPHISSLIKSLTRKGPIRISNLS